MIEKIKAFLTQMTELKGWKIEQKETFGYQLFFIKQELDMNRAIHTLEYEVTLYKEYRMNDIVQQGEAHCIIHPTMTDQEIQDKLNEMEILTSLSLNPPYDLVKKQIVKTGNREVAFDEKSLKDICFQIADNIFEADKFDHGYVNSSEIYVFYEKIHFLNSLEQEFCSFKSYGQLDIVVTWKDQQDAEEIELHRFYEFDALKTDFIPSAVNHLLVEAKNRAIAVQKSIEDKKIKVMLKDEALKEFFNYFVNKACVDFIYNRYSDYYGGKDLYPKDASGDRLTITLEAILPGSSKNTIYDNDGVSLKSLKMIQNGKVVNLWGSNQKSQYLHLPVNGKYQNFIVEPGTSNETDLTGKPYLEIVSLSDFNVDLLTGDFGSEIRFAYYHTKKGHIIPLTGGSLVGNIEECLPTIRLSQKQINLNNVKIPSYALLDKISVFNK